MIKEFKYQGHKVKIEVLLNYQMAESIDTAPKHLFIGSIDGVERVRRFHPDIQLQLAPEVLEKELRKMVRGIKHPTELTKKQLKHFTDNGFKQKL